jgi:hypothetical protein
MQAFKHLLMENGMMSVELRSWEEAETRILGWIEECAETGINRLGEALGLADDWGLDRDWVRERFREAENTWKEKLRRKAEEERAAALKKRPAAQPPVIEPAEIQPPPKKVVNSFAAALHAKFKREYAAEQAKKKAAAKAAEQPVSSHDLIEDPEDHQRFLKLGAEEREEVFKRLRATEDRVERKKILDEAFGEPQQSKTSKTAGPIMLPAVVPQPQPPTTADWAEALEAMNRQHAIIENVGGKAVIASWEPSTINPSRAVIVFQNKESFLLRYLNRHASIEVFDGRGNSRLVRIPLGTWWLEHRHRRQYRGVMFMPAATESVNGCLNLWQDWGVEEREGDWGLIREHIEKVLADGNREFAEYIICWIAWAIQNPAAQAEVALVLIGVKGAGKGSLVRCLQRIFGAHAFQVTSREEVIGKFNGHLQDCVLFIADEAYWGGDKRCIGRLQGMITEPTLPIERKGIDLIQVPNFLHVVMLAEPGWVIPAGKYERRYAALAVSSARRGDRAYFRALHQQIQNGGAEAIFYDLRRMDLGDWHPRDVPEALLTNPALQKQQIHTLPPLEQWYLTLLHNAVLPHALPSRPNTSYTKSLLEDAKERVPRLRWELTEPGLRNFLVDEETLGIVCTKYRTAVCNGWSFPPLAECREAWERRYGPVKWDSADKEWRKWSEMEGRRG